MKRSLAWANLVFASIVIVGVFVQVYLITAYVTGAGDGALDAHGFVGGIVVHLSELLVFLTALGAFWGAWRWIGFNFFLFLLGTVQTSSRRPTTILPAAGYTACTGSSPSSCSSSRR